VRVHDQFTDGDATPQRQRQAGVDRLPGCTINAAKNPLIAGGIKDRLVVLDPQGQIAHGNTLQTAALPGGISLAQQRDSAEKGQ
jgi:hypothetical protein